MGKKRKAEDGAKIKAKVSKKDGKKKPKKEVKSDSDDSDSEVKPVGVLEESIEMPPAHVMTKLLDRIEAQLPKDDHVKFDSRARKIDWSKISWEELSPSDCQKTWGHIQERIRRFRIMAEMIPDARTWISQPWTNFYKSKDHNRHPDMPKKPLSMYMLFYSEMREEILKTDPTMSMPEVAKACSEKYAKLSDKKKARYKARCDEMRRLYDEKMAKFYSDYPQLRPVKPEKSKKAAAAAAAAAAVAAARANQVQYMTHQAQPQIMQQQQQQHPQQPLVATISSAMGPVTTVPIQMDSISNNHQMQHPQQIHIKHDHDKIGNPFPNAPERPAKPFDLYFKSVVNERVNTPNFDRQSTAEQCRAEWKTMKVKKKAKWIRKAAENNREYEAEVALFMQENPGYVPPEKKNFLTQEDQKILDKHMGRPEKPPSSAYSLFSKEMLNNQEIKQYPSKERMSQISERWKLINQEQRDRYQAQVNESMSHYRQQYEQWFNDLNEDERKAETARNNTSKSKNKVAAAAKIPKPATIAMPQPGTSIQHQAPVAFTMTPQVLPQQIIVQAQPMPPQRDVNQLRQEILNREPVEPARSPKQLYIAEWLNKHKKKKPADAKDAWKKLDKKEKKKWAEKLEPQRQKYIDDYTVFVRALDKEELELYTEMKGKRDDEEEAKRQNESSDSEDSETSESESDSDSESESD